MVKFKHISSRLALPFPFGKAQWPAAVPKSAPKSQLGANFEGAWGRRQDIRAIRSLVTDYVTKPAMKVLASPSVTGGDRIAQLQGPVIFAANHASHLDTPLLLTSLPERFRYKTAVGAGADYFFDKRWKSYMWTFLLAAIPIERTRVSRRSSQLALDAIEEGWSLVLFPEGGRTPDGFAHEFKGGVAHLAIQAGVSVVPVYIAGTYDILGKHAKKLRPGDTVVNFGAPMSSAGQETRAFARQIEAAVAQLGDEVHFGYWAALRNHAGAEPAVPTPAQDRSWIDSWRRPRVDGSKASDHNRWPRLPIFNKPL